MFIDNKYKKIYFGIISFAQKEIRSKGKDVYYERHHILPKSLGGSNETDNLVLLTAREHYVCHLLLIKFTDGVWQHKMKSAFSHLQGRHKALELNNFSSRRYQRDRERSILRGEEHPRFGKPVSEKQLTRMQSLTGENALMFGKKHSEESKAKMSASRKGKKRGIDNPMFGKIVSKETRQKISSAQTGEKNHAYGVGCLMPNGERYAGENHGMWGKVHSDETRAKIRAAVKGTQDGEKNRRYGYQYSDEEKEKLRQNMKGRKWIKHIETNQNIMVWPDEVQSYIDKGWQHGRILK